jgi:phospholipid-binding lipoprotein MlaA
MFKNIIYILLVTLLFNSGVNRLIADEFSDEFEYSVEEKSDPLSGYNIVMTDFNDGFYIYIFDPVAKGYKYVTPKIVRESVDNFFDNLLYPLRFVNNILQGKFANATEETGRFMLNTTIGIGGFFDPAKKYFDLKQHNEDFGQTLGKWGVDGGYHIVLPFFGPSNMRDMFSMYPNYLMNPVSYVDEAVAITVYNKLNNASLHIGEYGNLKKNAIELYPFLKNVYEQNRKKLIEE